MSTPDATSLRPSSRGSAAMFAPGMALAFLPFPIVRTHRQVEFGAVVIGGASMPTIAVGIADDSLVDVIARAPAPTTAASPEMVPGRENCPRSTR
jgi:hypothetical protein